MPAPEKLPEVEIGNTTIGGLLDSVADRFGDSTALQYHRLGISDT